MPVRVWIKPFPRGPDTTHAERAVPRLTFMEPSLAGQITASGGDLGQEDREEMDLLLAWSQPI